MSKYFAAFKNGLQSRLIYRFNTVVYFFSSFLVLLIFFYIWGAIYRQGGQIGNYALPQLIFYYLATNFIGMTVKSGDMAYMVGDEIRLGRLTNFLLKPLDYFWYKISTALSGLFYQGFVSLLVFSVAAILLISYFSFPLRLSNIFYFFLLLIPAFFIYSLVFYIIGLSTFWFGFIWAFNFTMQMVVSFLEGGLIPLDLLPRFLVQINNWLPFKYIMFTPISVLTGRQEINLSVFLIPLAWIVVLYLLSRLMFKKGLKKYESFGA